MSTTSIKDIRPELVSAGAHVGITRARRHPTATKFILGSKERTDIFDLQQTGTRLDDAVAYAASLTQAGKQILFVGGKHEAVAIVESAAKRAGQPYVAGRWIGGTLTNFRGIHKRVELLERLMGERERGELGKYTKKERLLIDRRIDELLKRFGGIVSMKDLPAALFVVDTRHEAVAVKEANQLRIPVIGLANSDCDFSLIQYPIPANDTSIRSISAVADAISEGCVFGKKAHKEVPAPVRN